MPGPDYRAVAYGVAAEIAAGRLRPGDRLPPQRDFAYARGIAVSTASRVYAELARRGLVLGEVGRGTYIRSDLGAPGAIQAEPPPAAIAASIRARSAAPGCATETTSWSPEVSCWNRHDRPRIARASACASPAASVVGPIARKLGLNS